MDKFELRSISQSCDLSRSIYEPIKPNVFDRVFSSGKVSVGYNKDVDDNVIFTFAGSQNLIDIERDLELEEHYHHQLGTIVKGFWEGMNDVWIEIEPMLHTANSISINGHSLGASHAIYLAGLCHFNGYEVLSLHLFAPPKSSHLYLKDTLQKNIPYLRAFTNGLDPVPHLPLGDWQQYVLIDLDQKPESFFCTPIGYHNIDLYFKGISKLKVWHKSLFRKFINYFTYK